MRSLLLSIVTLSSTLSLTTIADSNLAPWVTEARMNEHAAEVTALQAQAETARTELCTNLQAKVVPQLASRPEAIRAANAALIQKSLAAADAGCQGLHAVRVRLIEGLDNLESLGYKRVTSTMFQAWLQEDCAADGATLTLQEKIRQHDGDLQIFKTNYESLLSLFDNFHFRMSAEQRAIIQQIRAVKLPEVLAALDYVSDYRRDFSLEIVNSFITSACSQSTTASVWNLQKIMQLVERLPKLDPTLAPVKPSLDKLEHAASSWMENEYNWSLESTPPR